MIRQFYQTSPYLLIRIQSLNLIQEIILSTTCWTFHRIYAHADVNPSTTFSLSCHVYWPILVCHISRVLQLIIRLISFGNVVIHTPVTASKCSHKTRLLDLPRYDGVPQGNMTVSMIGERRTKPNCK